MAVYFFDGNGLIQMFAGGTNMLGELQEEINKLNVFPVPDGDTGINMYLTMKAAVEGAQQVDDPENIGSVAEAAAKGALLGARGNSGVILSQVLNGFAGALKGKSKASAQDIALGLEEGSKAAYKAVANPVEGTILTVVNKTAEAAREAASRSADLLRMMIVSYRRSLITLRETPKMLPVLKEAGVVDAGGKGFSVILEGILRTLKVAEEIELIQDFATRQERKIMSLPVTALDEEIEFKYCTELIVRNNGRIAVQALRSELEPYGDCLLVVGDQDVAKVHIHTNHPGFVLECCINYGDLNDIKVDNMTKQHQDLLVMEEKDLGLVSISPGDGLTEIMYSLGVDQIVNGGQTMNPSTDDIIRAVENVAAREVVVLPNNKNILLTANQAMKNSTKKITVVPTVTIPQALAVLLAANPNEGVGENIGRMEKALETVKSGEVTRAVRDCVIGNRKIHEGDYLGVSENGICSVGDNLGHILTELIHNMLGEYDELVTLYYGSDLTEMDAEKAVGDLRKNFADCEFEFYYGGQPHYHFIISVE